MTDDGASLGKRLFRLALEGSPPFADGAGARKKYDVVIDMAIPSTVEVRIQLGRVLSNVGCVEWQEADVFAGGEGAWRRTVTPDEHVRVAWTLRAGVNLLSPKHYGSLVMHIDGVKRADMRYALGAGFVMSFRPGRQSHRTGGCKSVLAGF